jgi:inorganic triphosphatase YgiF
MNASGRRLARWCSIRRHGCYNTGTTEERGIKTTRKTDATAKAWRLAPLSLCVARTALKYLHALMAEMEGVRQAEDRECVHRLRVASRRLRSVLPLFATTLSRQTWARWRKQLRRVTRVLGAARDADVQMACVQQFLHDRTRAEEQVGV